MKKRNAHSLIELLVVLIIVSILIAIVVPAVNRMAVFPAIVRSRRMERPPSVGRRKCSSISAAVICRKILSTRRLSKCWCARVTKGHRTRRG